MSETENEKIAHSLEEIIRICTELQEQERQRQQTTSKFNFY